MSAPAAAPSPPNPPAVATRKTANSDMELHIMRHTWGLDNVSLSSFFSQLRESHKPYQGVEAGLIWLNQAQRAELKQILEVQKFSWIAMIFTDTPISPSDSVAAHVAEFERQVAEALTFSTVKPLLFNVHGGRDSWTHEQQEEYFQTVLTLAAKLPVPVVHETHRGRILYNPWITRDFLQKFPTLHLCADLSHFVVVAERLINTPEFESILSLVASRTHHIHARVGYEQGPQVSDPRAPEFASYVQAFESMWDKIWQIQAQQGNHRVTLTPEYGPAPYQPLLPYTQQPIANLNDIVDWAAVRLHARFQANESNKH